MPKDLITTRVLLCDVQGIRSLLESVDNLNSALLAIAEAYDSALQYSQLDSAPKPQQGFGDAVWWVSTTRPLDWIKTLRSYAIFAAQLLASSKDLPFVLVAPSVACEGMGIFRLSPWAQSIATSELASMSAQNIATDWLYSTAMHTAWELSESPSWRKSSPMPAPMLLQIMDRKEVLRQTIASALDMSAKDISLELMPRKHGKDERREADVHHRELDNSRCIAESGQIRLTNCFDLIIRWGLRIHALKISDLPTLATCARHYSLRHQGRPAEIQRQIARSLDHAHRTLA